MMKHYTAPEGVWLPVDEESILATANSGGFRLKEDTDDCWGKLYLVNGR